MKFVLVILLVSGCRIGESSQKHRDEYNEEAFFKPLPSGHINTFFQFSIDWDFDKAENRKCIRIPGT